MKKPKLLSHLMGGEKRRHHVAAFVTQEGDWNRHEPNTGFARVFIAMLILHVFIIGGIILSDFSSSSKTAPRAPMVSPAFTKSKTEIGGALPHAAATSYSAEESRLQHYTVHSGDSVQSIAARLGVDKEEFIHVNHLDENGQFAPGSVLLIPEKKPEGPLAVATAHAMPEISVKPPSDEPPSAAQTLSSAPSPATEISSAPVSKPSSTTTVMLADANGTPVDLVPLPTIPTDEVRTERKTEADSPPEKKATVVSNADSAPRSANKEKSEKGDKSDKSEKSAPKKAIGLGSRPNPVPPPSEMAKRPATKPEPTSKTTGKPSGTKGTATTHVLAKGETLYRLSNQFGVSVESLIKANSIKDPAKLRDGTKLIIPAKQ